MLNETDKSKKLNDNIYSQEGVSQVKNSLELSSPQVYPKPTPYPISTQQNTADRQLVYAGFTSKDKVIPSYFQVTELVRGLKFVFPVTIKIERIEESLFVAECPMLNISIPAENYEAALDEIKEVLVDDYRIFLGNYPDKLTKEALNTLRLYQALFGEELPQ